MNRWAACLALRFDCIVCGHGCWEGNVHRIQAVGLAALAGCLLASATASAAGPDFCRDYARAAIEQSRRAHDVPNCAPGARGPRWTMDWRMHFDWCRGADWRAVNSERAARRNYLHYCGAIR